VAFAAFKSDIGRFVRGFRGNDAPLSHAGRQKLAGPDAGHLPKSLKEIPMLLAIPNAISAAVSEMSHHGHKKGVHGSSSNSSSTDSTSSTDESGSTQGLFGSLMDTAEQMVGIQTPTSTTTPSAAGAAGAASTLASASTPTSTAAMINAARAALHKTA
jgi:hypothetical protein